MKPVPRPGSSLSQADEENIRSSPVKRYILLTDRILREIQGLPPKELPYEEIWGRELSAQMALTMMVPAPKTFGDYAIRYLSTMLSQAAPKYDIPVSGLSYAQVIAIVHKHHRDLWNEVALSLGLAP